MQWIEVIQCSVELRIANNGHLSAPFMVHKGVVQGDAFSPFLFILMMESLGTCVRNYKVRGLQSFGLEKKVAMVANDSLFLVECEQENLQLFTNILSHFQFVSGLHVNLDKTNVVPLNPSPDWVHWDCVQPFKVLTFYYYFPYLGTLLCPAVVFADTEEVRRKNFPYSKNLIEDSLKSQRIGATCITGRVLQVKSLIASRFVYSYQMLPSPPRNG